MARLIEPFMTYFDDNGVPLNGGKLQFNVSGSPSSAKDTFSDALLTTANPNPIILDSAGRVPDNVIDVFGDGNYRLIVKNSADIAQETFDPVTGGIGILGVANIAALTAQTKASLSDGDERFISGFTTQGDGGQDNFFWDSTSSATVNGGTIFASDEGGTGRWIRFPRSFIDAREFGKIGQGGDDSALIQAAIDFKETLGGIVWLAEPPAGTYLCNNLILPDGVYLNGELGPTASPSGARASLVTANAAGKIIDTAASSSRNTGVIGVAFQGLGAGTAVDAIHFDNVARGIVKNCSFNNLSGHAIKLDSDTGACNIIDNHAQNCLLDRTQAAKIGVLDVDGNDHWVTRGEYTASLSALSDANARLCAVVLRGGEHMMTETVADISDCGVHVTGVTSPSRLISVRSDLNWGNGFEMEGTTYLTTCLALRNGRETTNTYDGYLLSVGNSTLTGCIARSLSADAWAHRYGFNDTQASDTVKSFYDSGCRSSGHETATFNITATGGAHNTPTGAPKTFTDTDTTPSVENYGTFIAANTTPTSITDFADPTEGQKIEILATNTNTKFVHNASILFTSTGRDRVSVANSVYKFTHWNGIWYETSSAGGSIKHSMVHTAVASGTSIEWTDIPADVQNIRIVFSDQSFSNGAELALELGDSSSYETSGYSGLTNNVAGSTGWSAEGLVTRNAEAVDILNGFVTIDNISGNLWQINMQTTVEGGGATDGAGDKTLTGTLTRVRLISNDATGTFDGTGINAALYYQ